MFFLFDWISGVWILCADVSERPVISIFIGVIIKLEQTGCSEISAHKIQTPGESPKRRNTTIIYLRYHLFFRPGPQYPPPPQTHKTIPLAITIVDDRAGLLAFFGIHLWRHCAAVYRRIWTDLGFLGNVFPRHVVAHEHKEEASGRHNRCSWRHTYCRCRRVFQNTCVTLERKSVLRYGY